MRAFLLSIGVLLLGSATVSACPDWTQSGDRFALTGDELFREQSFPVIAGGDTNVQGCGNVDPQTDKGAGYVMARPDFTFDLTGLSGYRLVAMVESECDSILLVNTATANWYYNDDDAGSLDARIDLTSPTDGLFDIWVGTHNGEYCEAVLSLETFRP